MTLNKHSFISARMALALSPKQRQGLYIMCEPGQIIIAKSDGDIYPTYLALASDNGMQARHIMECDINTNRILLRFREWDNHSHIE